MSKTLAAGLASFAAYLAVFLAPTAFCSAVVGLFAVAGPGGPAAWRYFLGGAVVGGIGGTVLVLIGLCFEDEITERKRG